jgi:hypothetical protein
MPRPNETTLKLEWTDQSSRIFKVIRVEDMAHVATDHDEPGSWEYHEWNHYSVLLFPRTGRTVVNNANFKGSDSQWLDADSVSAAIGAYDELVTSCG